MFKTKLHAACGGFKDTYNVRCRIREEESSSSTPQSEPSHAVFVANYAHLFTCNETLSFPNYNQTQLLCSIKSISLPCSMQLMIKFV
jgi:hypothetical protein